MDAKEMAHGPSSIGSVAAASAASAASAAAAAASGVKKKKPLVGILACDSCRSSKVKCDGKNPCSRCARRGTHCHFSPGRKRGPQPQSAKEAAAREAAAKEAAAAAANVESSSSSSCSSPSPHSLVSEWNPELSSPMLFPQLPSFVIATEISPELGEEENAEEMDCEGGNEESPPGIFKLSAHNNLGEPASGAGQDLGQDGDVEGTIVTSGSGDYVSTSLLIGERELSLDAIVNSYMDTHIRHLSEFWNEPDSFFRRLVNPNLLQGQIQLYSTLSLFLRSDRNLDLSTTFLNKAVTLAKNVFDDYNSPTSFMSGLSMAMVSFALAPTDLGKSKFYSKLAINLLEEIELGELKYQMMKQMLVNTFKHRFTKKPVPKGDLVDYLSTFESSGQIEIGEAPTRAPTTSKEVTPTGVEAALWSNPLYHVIKKHFRFTIATQGAQQNKPLAGRLFLIENYFALRNLITSFLPHLTENQEVITERSLEVPEGSLPVPFANALLEYVDTLEKIASRLPPLPSKMVTTFYDIKTIAHRSLGNADRAVEAAREGLNRYFFFVENGEPQTLLRLTMPLFFCGGCLVHYGKVDEVDVFLARLSPFSDLFLPVEMVCGVISTLRDRLITASTSSPQPQPLGSPTPKAAPPSLPLSPLSLSLTRNAPLSSPQISLNELNSGMELGKFWQTMAQNGQSYFNQELPTADLGFLEEALEESLYQPFF